MVGRQRQRIEIAKVRTRRVADYLAMVAKTDPQNFWQRSLFDYFLESDRRFAADKYINCRAFFQDPFWRHRAMGPDGYQADLRKFFFNRFCQQTWLSNGGQRALPAIDRGRVNNHYFWLLFQNHGGYFLMRKAKQVGVDDFRLQALFFQNRCGQGQIQRLIFPGIAQAKNPLLKVFLTGID